MGARSLVVAPIVAGGQGVGALMLVSDQANHFGDTDSDVVELMAGFVAASFSTSSPLEHEAQRALQDPLTGLPNRMILMDRLQQAIYDARRYDRPFGLFVLEPDGIEGVSMALGRDATDAVLRAISTGLNTTVRSGDTLARIDDDQFVILCINADRSVVEDRIRTRVESVSGIGHQGDRPRRRGDPGAPRCRVGFGQRCQRREPSHDGQHGRLPRQAQASHRPLRPGPAPPLDAGRRPTWPIQARRPESPCGPMGA